MSNGDQIFSSSATEKKRMSLARCGAPRLINRSEILNDLSGEKFFFEPAYHTSSFLILTNGQDERDVLGAGRAQARTVTSIRLAPSHCQRAAGTAAEKP